MKNYALTAAALALTAGAAHAGGLDRSGTPIDPLFEKGNYAEVSLGFIMPDVTGNDVGGNNYSNVGDDFTLLGAALKMDIGEKLSFAVILDQPYGADILYGGSPAATLLGGTFAQARSNAITALVRFKFNDRFSLYGGPRILKADGKITLSGLAYGLLNGYHVNFASDEGIGYVAGAAFEIPDIALRASLTYHSSIDLKFNTIDSLGTPAANTKSELPQSVEISLQSGVSQNTLVFGSFRWSDWSAFELDPPNPFVPNLAQLDDVYSFELGVGHRFSEKLSASITGILELKGGSDSLVSPLAPTNGRKAISIGGKYKVNDKVDISGGIRYTWLGDGLPETGTPDTRRGTFRNNTAISVGLKLGFHF
jgi:long-subunit fatty acid transport protein